SGPEQFLEIAAFNQLALERGLSPEDLVGGTQVTSSPVKTRTNSDLNSRRSEPKVASYRRENPLRNRISALDISDQELEISLSRLSSEKCNSLRLEVCRNDMSLESERIWGQVNRLFPLKFACRWMSVIAAESSCWPTLQRVTEVMVSDAATLGSALEKQDNIY